MSRDRGIGEQFLERPQPEQFVDQHLFQRELFAPVERQLQLGEHLADDRAEFLGQFVLAQRRRGFGIDAFEQAREHLFLDLVDRAFESLGAAVARIAARRLAIGQPLHRIDLLPGMFPVSGASVSPGMRQRIDRREIAIPATSQHRGARGRCPASGGRRRRPAAPAVRPQSRCDVRTRSCQFPQCRWRGVGTKV